MATNRSSHQPPRTISRLAGVLAAKRAVAKMPVQFAFEEHADVRTVFEVYATYALGTKEYNCFQTH